MNEIIGYSLKAKKKVALQQPVEVKLNPNGKSYMAKGKCPVTGNTVTAIMKKELGDAAIASGHKKVDAFSF